MGKAIFAFILSAGLGIWFSFFDDEIGVILAISIMGAFIICQNEKNKKNGGL